jgi:hypothetical protein
MRGLASIARCLLAVSATTLLGCSTEPTISPEVQARLTVVAGAGPAELARFALSDPVPAVRLAAVARMTDQATLAQIATGDAWTAVRKQAVERLDRQDVLEQVALKDARVEVQASAVERLQDPAAFERVVKAAPRAIEAPFVQRLTDPARLLAIAREHGSEPIRTLALNRLTDQSQLKLIAQTGRFADTRVNATRRIQDPALLEQLALADSRPEVAEAAARGLTDPARLAALAQSKWPSVRRLVASRSDDVALLRAFATQDKSAEVRRVAAARIKDPQVLRDLALGSDVEVRRVAVDRIDDPQVWAAVARKETDPMVAQSILQRTHDPAIAADLLVRTAALMIACPAAGRVQDVAKLQAVAARPDGSAVRRLVEFRLLLEHPAIKRRAPDLSMICTYEPRSQAYGMHQYSHVGGILVGGETVHVRVLRAGRDITSDAWTTQFPPTVTQQLGFIPAHMNLERLAGAVIDAAGLDDIEIAELTGAAYGSDIRVAAIMRSKDQAALERMLLAEKQFAVREGIQRRLKSLGAQ